MPIIAGPENPLIWWMRRWSRDNPVFLVGGPVRDLLLGRGVKDYDFLLEGRVFDLAERLGQKFKTKVYDNKHLLTASLETSWGRVDLAAARREDYPCPGAIPRIKPASWPEDLFRRDFSINALALPLLPEGWGEVIDVTGGLSDLEKGLLRVLHRESFRDDPTRILRGIRFKNRLGFRFEENTLKSLQRGWEYLRRISPQRRLKEWKLLWEEEWDTSLNSLEDIFHLGGWQDFLGGVPYNPGLGDILSRLHRELRGKGSPLRTWFLCLLPLFAQEPERVPVFCRYLGLSPRDTQDLAKTLYLAGERDSLLVLNHRQLQRTCRGLPPEGILHLFTQVLGRGEEWEDFYQGLLEARMPVRGQDLLNLGIRPGPEMGRLLRKLEHWYWEGLFTSREEGLQLAGKLWKEE